LIQAQGRTEGGRKETTVPVAGSSAYYRISTRAQGRSGIGLEAQQAAVSRFLLSTSSELFAEFTEVESGKKAARPPFNEALRLCRIFSAVLVIAKLDRLARNVALISQLMESRVEFVAADFPQANRLTIHIFAAIAEYEATLISERVKASIVASKARGVVWGDRNSPTAHLDEARRVGNEGRRRRAAARALDLEPLIMEMREGGRSLKGLHRAVNSSARCEANLREVSLEQLACCGFCEQAVKLIDLPFELNRVEVADGRVPASAMKPSIRRCSFKVEVRCVAN
jgi:DNA invertase Pin-like site-specific DNA recombinase